MVLSISLRCSVCDGTFETKEEWLNHLLQEGHQSQARKEILKWGQAERDCMILVYSSFPVACFDLLHFFCQESDKLVTDFIYFPDRPKLGFVQFERKLKAEEVFESVTGPSVIIGNEPVELKKGWECFDLEWEDRMSSFLEVQQQKVNSKKVVCKKEPEDEGHFEEPIPKRARVVSVSESVPSQVSVPFAESHAVSEKFISLCREVEISKDRFGVAAALKNKLRDALSFKFPNCGLRMFRNWYLNLKSGESNDLLLFMDYQESPSLVDHPTRRIDSRIDTGTTFEINHIAFYFKNIYGVSAVRVQKRASPLSSSKEKGLGHSFFHIPSGIYFRIVNCPLYLPEVETCRLLEYLLTFDSRAKPLLQIIRYWALHNNIRLTRNNESFVPGFPPNPAILDWLVILFLCQKGILPTPRQICERPHNELILDGVDIGFSADTEFARTFSSYQLPSSKDTHVHSFNVLKLSQKFFDFYPRVLNCGYSNIVFNTRDGQVFPIPDENDYCQLTADEISFLRTEKRHENRLERTNFKHGQLEITMINPLFVKHGFPIFPNRFRSSVCLAMNKTARKLKRRINAWNKPTKKSVSLLESAFKLK